MKKVFAVLIMLAMFTASASAEVTGFLARAGDAALDIPAEKHNSEAEKYLLAEVLDSHVYNINITKKFYDSLTLMQLALNKGEIDSIYVPENIGEYMLRSNQNYNLRGFYIMKLPVAMAFGFLKDKQELCDKFNKAIQDMEAEGKIGLLARDFITGPAAQNPPAVEFENFEGAETITVAVTGDMPPIDYVAADGKPAGFNTAILAEIGRRLHVNIKPVTVETGARAAILKSGRADAVFWFLVFRGYDAELADVPEDVIISTPYYGWNKTVLIGRK